MKRSACMARPRNGFRFGGLLLAAIAVAAPPALAGVNRWTSGGPVGIRASCLAIDPTNPDRVFAATGQTVFPAFRSTNGGLSWTAPPLGLSPGYGGSSGLAIDPLSPSVVYATTMSNFAPTTATVLKSVDGGGTWVDVAPLPFLGGAYSVAVDPITPGTVHAGTASGLFKSTDAGSSWTRTSAYAIYNLVFDPQTPSTMFGVEVPSFYYPTSYLHKSTDGGTTWSDHQSPIEISPGTLAIDPINSSTLYAGGEDGVYKSVDSGLTWAHTSSGLVEYVHGLVVDPRNPGTVYFSNGGVFRSTDGGTSWSEFNAGLNNRFTTTLAIDRSGTRLYADTGDGVLDYQIYSGALDLSVGSDNTARLLFVDLDNRALFRSFDNSGSSVDGGSASFNGFYPRAVVDGGDGLTRVLWNGSDGATRLWLGLPGSQAFASSDYGVVGNWTAVDVSVAPDNTTQFLWTNPDGRMGLWTLDSSGTLIDSSAFGPFPGWVARSISHGADGVTRVLWSNADGRVGLSLIDGDQIVATYRYTPGPGWTARDLAMASDQQARILLVHSDGEMALWSVNNSGAVTNHGPVYEAPVLGQSASRVAAGADGLTRVLWTSPEGTGSLSLMGLDNALQTSFGITGNWDY